MNRFATIARNVAIGAAALAATSVVATKVIDQGKNEQPAGHPQGFYERHVKRPQDFACALLATVALAPVMGATALLVRARLGSPVIFKQQRPGKDERVFDIYKFRSMTDERDENGRLLPDIQRLSDVGKAIRMSSLDELPELFNILKGDMAVVGPRPLLVSYLPYYSKREHARHSVRPGLTGLAQTHGRNTLDWDDRLEMDVAYAENITFATDVRIVLRTIEKVCVHDGVAVDSADEGNLAEIRQKRA